MPELQTLRPGTFCWIELQTKHLGSATRFYGDLFGWGFEDVRMNKGHYTIAKVDDKPVAGLTTVPERAGLSGEPASWGSYVAVEDVEATTETAIKLGAKQLLRSTSMGAGRFSALLDPTGAVFMTWHSPEPMGFFLYGEPGSLVWNELISTNPDVAQRFYTQLFGWKAEPSPVLDMPYTIFKAGDQSVGGLMAQPSHMKGAPSLWTVCFAVADADQTFATATKAGAKVLMSLTDLPKVGRFGWLQDPHGAAFAVLKRTPA